MLEIGKFQLDITVWLYYLTNPNLFKESSLFLKSSHTMVCLQYRHTNACSTVNNFQVLQLQCMLTLCFTCMLWLIMERIKISQILWQTCAEVWPLKQHTDYKCNHNEWRSAKIIWLNIVYNNRVTSLSTLRNVLYYLYPKPYLVGLPLFYEYKQQKWDNYT